MCRVPCANQSVSRLLSLNETSLRGLRALGCGQCRGVGSFRPERGRRGHGQRCHSARAGDGDTSGGGGTACSRRNNSRDVSVRRNIQGDGTAVYTPGSGMPPCARHGGPKRPTPRLSARKMSELHTGSDGSLPHDLFAPYANKARDVPYSTPCV